MRIIILTVNHAYSNLVVKEMIKKHKDKIVLIVESGVFLPHKSNFKSIKKYYQVSGPYYVIFQIIRILIFKAVSRIYTPLFSKKSNNKFYSYRALAQKYHIPDKKIFDVNSPKSIALFKEKKPDLIVSVLFNQILGSEIINIAKNGAINLHPAYLPNYKGVSPVFWVLANGEKETGVSVHFVDTGIDTGRIITRKKIKIKESDSEDTLYWRCVKAGAPILLSAISSISRGNIRYTLNKNGSYFSLPSRQAVKRFRQNHRAIFKLKELLFLN